MLDIMIIGWIPQKAQNTIMASVSAALTASKPLNGLSMTPLRINAEMPAASTPAARKAQEKYGVDLLE